MSEENHPIELLTVNGLEKSYGGKTAVAGLSFHVNKGEIVGLLGPNGAGKTTTFYMTVGLIKPDKGRVCFDGKDVTKLPMHKRAQLGMGYLAQEPSVFRNLTVEQNLHCVLETLDLAKGEMASRKEELMAELNLEKLAKKKARELSGGERRRLEITRALVTNPSLLLLDEPFANIDPIAVGDLQKLVRHLKNKGISILITDHNARELFAIADRSYLIAQGRVLLCGSAQELLENEQARHSYFGSDFKL